MGAPNRDGRNPHVIKSSKVCKYSSKPLIVQKSLREFVSQIMSIGTVCNMWVGLGYETEFFYLVAPI